MQRIVTDPTRGFRPVLNRKFTAKLQESSSKGGWTYLVWPGSVKFFETRGLVKVTGTMDGHPFQSSFMARGDGTHMLPVKAEIRRTIGKDVGDSVRVHLRRAYRVNFDLPGRALSSISAVMQS